MQQMAPTKSYLLKAKSSIALSQKGFELLEKKKQILMHELAAHTKEANQIQDALNESATTAYASLQMVNLTMGITRVEDLAIGIPKDEAFEIVFKSVMGVLLPTVRYKKKPLYPAYGFYDTNPAIDEAISQFEKLKYNMYQLATIDYAILRLTKEIEKLQRRTSTLQHLQIPRYLSQIKQIESLLEEKEREDYFRLKQVKKLF